MKVLIDENLPPALAKALHALFEGDHDVVHLRARFGPAVQDREWIETLSAEGRWIVISGDRRITRNRAEYMAFRNSRLVGFFLSRGLVQGSACQANGTNLGALERNGNPVRDCCRWRYV